MGQVFQALKQRFAKAQRIVAAGLTAFLLLFTTDCTLTIGDLQYSNPDADTYTICDTPTEVQSHVTLFAINWSTGKIVTNDNEVELHYFSSLADAFYIVDRNAPKWTAQLMPLEYGLNCENRLAILPESTDILPLYCPAPTFAETLAKTMVRPDGNYVGQASEVKTRCQPVRIPVCAKPASVPKGVTQWAKWDKKGKLIVNTDKAFADAAKNADIVFYLDKNAPAESVYWFVKDPKELSCPHKPPPIPYKEAQDSGKLVLLTAATQMAGLMYGPPKTGNGKDSSSSGTMSASANSSSSPSSGGSRSDSSSRDGKGPPLDFLEAVSRGIALTGALAQGDTSGNIKDPNGSRYGIPNGKDPGGPDLIALQAAVSLFAIVQNPIKKSRDFVNLIREGLAKGEVVIIRNPAHLSKELAEKLAESPKQKLTRENIDMAESFGESMAPSLNKTRTIMPYSRAQVFTKGWKGDYQAHHIFEVQMMKDVGHGAEAIENSPAIILSKVEHEQVTKRLNDVRNAMKAKLNVDKLDKNQLWAMYKQVYADKPTWLEAIKGYFQP